MSVTMAYGFLGLLLLCGGASVSGARGSSCNPSCNLGIVESIPENLTYAPGSPSHISSYKAWMALLATATESVDIASFYWTLQGRGAVKDPTDKDGWNVFHELADIGSHGVKIRIVQNQPNSEFPDLDSLALAEMGAAEVRNLSVEALLGSGVLHTKLWVVDQKHFYMGSANMDWRALTQVKELGVLGTDCECLAQDAQKLFDVYWYLASPGAHIPSPWPPQFSANFNLTSPASISINGTPALAFWASSPPPFCAHSRTDDLTALLHVIEAAQQFVYVAVMDYFPAIIYQEPEIYWSRIDDALRSAAYSRGVHVRVMGSYWNHTWPDMLKFLKSLAEMNGTGSSRGTLEVKLFTVPPLPSKHIPYTRVNHNKYMVTDNAAYIGTSNWSGDYFIDTGGVSLTVNQTHASPYNTTVQEQLLQVFERDWNSRYAVNIFKFSHGTAKEH